MWSWVLERVGVGVCWTAAFDWICVRLLIVDVVVSNISIRLSGNWFGKEITSQRLGYPEMIVEVGIEPCLSRESMKT